MGLFKDLDLSGMSDLIKKGQEKAKKPDEYAKVPDGLYLCYVEGLEAKLTSEEKGSTPFLAWRLNIYEEGSEYHGHILYHNRFFIGQEESQTIKNIARLTRELKIFVGDDFEFGDNFENVTDEIIETKILGQWCTVKATTSKAGGQFYQIGKAETEEAVEETTEETSE